MWTVSREITLNGRVLAIGIAMSVLAPLGFALMPALRMSRPDMDELRQGNRSAESTRGRRLRESLVVAQLALALILMTQGGLIGRTTWKLHHLERGFDADHLLTLRMNLAEADYRDPAAAHDFYERALDRIRTVPGVTAAATTTALPIADREMSLRFQIQGRPARTTRLAAPSRTRRHQRRLSSDDARADRARTRLRAQRLRECAGRGARHSRSRAPVLAR
jgi:hypothetical protein